MNILLKKLWIRIGLALFDEGTSRIVDTKWRDFESEQAPSVAVDGDDADTEKDVTSRWN